MKNGRRRRTVLVCSAAALMLASPGAVLAAESPTAGHATAATAADSVSAGSSSSQAGSASATPVSAAGQTPAGASQATPGTSAGSLLTIGKEQSGQVNIAPYAATVGPDGSASAGSAALSIMARAIGTQAYVLQSSSQTSSTGQTQNSSDVASVKLGVFGWTNLFHTGSNGDSYVLRSGGKNYGVNSKQTCGVDLKGHAGVACADQVPVSSSSPAVGGSSDTGNGATATGGVGGAVATAINNVSSDASASHGYGTAVGVIRGRHQSGIANAVGRVAHKLGPAAFGPGLSLTAGAGNFGVHLLVLLAFAALVGVVVAGRRAWVDGNL
ncbi:MAG: hypothetical protein QOG03_2455 [Actinomycetota bacterium]|jgi:hypothetical protein|nr:hypothetical protein [Actinomycetota bacterium]